MRIVVVMMNLAQFFARNLQQIRKIIVAGGNYHFPRVQHSRPAKTVDGVNNKCAIGSSYALDAMILADVQAIVSGHLAVILQGFVSRGLRVRAWKRDVADFEQFGRSEKGHMRWIVVKRIADATFIDRNRPKTCLLGFNRAG